jgi:Glycosyl transferase family 2
MKSGRVLRLSMAFLQVSRRDGIREAVRRGVRRVRDRLIRPALQSQAAMRQDRDILLSRLDRLGQLADAHGRQLDGLGKLADTHGRQLDGLEQRLDGLEQRLDGLEQRLDGLERSVRDVRMRHSDSILWLAEHHPGAAAPASARPTELTTGPRVSVIMATYNRERLVSDAIESVLAQTYTHWELLIIDDGSTDGTREVVGRYQSDPRVRYRLQDHLGAAAARNQGLTESRGEIIAYLDSDNTWLPGTLAAVADAFAADPQCDAVYLAQVRRDHATGDAWIHAAPFDRRALLLENSIDLNTFAHRRRLFERFGGFDADLTRFIDWDLILRYTADCTPKQLPVVGGRYEIGPWERITTRENSARNRYLVLHKSERPLHSPPRVLYALWHYPQLSETYIATEIERVRRWGVHVEVWSQVGPVSPFPTSVPVHRGTLAAAIERARPDVVHIHWLNVVSAYRDAIERAGLLATVRGHGFDFSPDLAIAAEQDPVIRAIYLFPHLANACPPGLGKVRPMTSCFNPDRFYPVERKDPRLVLHAGAGLLTKDIPLFMRVARECPNHRFVLAVVRCNDSEAVVDELVEQNRSLGSPVDLRVNVPLDEMASLVRKAGIYLHTHAPDGTYGMPASVCEAMATGAYVIGRRCAASEDYIGEESHCYDDEEQAARLIRMTTEWSRERWHQAQVRAIDRAYGHFVDSVVLRPILEDWMSIAAHAAAAVPLRISA